MSAAYPYYSAYSAFLGASAYGCTRGGSYCPHHNPFGHYAMPSFYVPSAYAPLCSSGDYYSTLQPSHTPHHRSYDAFNVVVPSWTHSSWAPWGNTMSPMALNAQQFHWSPLALEATPTQGTTSTSFGHLPSGVRYVGFSAPRPASNRFEGCTVHSQRPVIPPCANAVSGGGMMSGTIASRTSSGLRMGGPSGAPQPPPTPLNVSWALPIPSPPASTFLSRGALPQAGGSNATQASTTTATAVGAAGRSGGPLPPHVHASPPSQLDAVRSAEYWHNADAGHTHGTHGEGGGSDVHPAAPAGLSPQDSEPPLVHGQVAPPRGGAGGTDATAAATRDALRPSKAGGGAHPPRSGSPEHVEVLQQRLGGVTGAVRSAPQGGGGSGGGGVAGLGVTSQRGGAGERGGQAGGRGGRGSVSVMGRSPFSTAPRGGSPARLILRNPSAARAGGSGGHATMSGGGATSAPAAASARTSGGRAVAQHTSSSTPAEQRTTWTARSSGEAGGAPLMRVPDTQPPPMGIGSSGGGGGKSTGRGGGKDDVDAMAVSMQQYSSLLAKCAPQTSQPPHSGGAGGAAGVGGVGGMPSGGGQGVGAYPPHGMPMGAPRGFGGFSAGHSGGGMMPTGGRGGFVRGGGAGGGRALPPPAALHGAMASASLGDAFGSTAPHYAASAHTVGSTAATASSTAGSPSAYGRGVLLGSASSATVNTVSGALAASASDSPACGAAALAGAVGKDDVPTPDSAPPSPAGLDDSDGDLDDPDPEVGAPVPPIARAALEAPTPTFIPNARR